MGEVERMCDDVIMLRAGASSTRVRWALIARYGRANLEEVFLDSPRPLRRARPRQRRQEIATL
jgi:ABC-2 type transport system ATP-binding protein